MAAIGYRPEIDGLRAIAVLSVLVFHIHAAWLPGGFAGVDVFFVISGFLITRVIATEIREGRFTYRGFYERRARRILPASLFLIAGVLAITMLFAPPRQTMLVAETAFAALLFVPNIYLWRESGYFTTSAEGNPLLHMWSLGVEEQFYFVFPLALLLLYRWIPARVLLAVVGMAALSLLLSIYFSPRNPSAAFYLLPTRAWEMMGGSILALLPDRNAERGKGAASVLSLIALGALAVTFALYSGGMVFPGYAALLPVAATMALIYWAPNTPVAALLSLRWVRFVGLVSYSLYLWHWPVIVFARVRGFEPSQPIVAVAIAGISVMLAVISWRVVERPFRQRKTMSVKTVALTCLTGTALGLGIAAAILAAKGVPQRFDPQVLAYENAVDDFSPFRKSCHRGRGRPAPPEKSCVLGGETSDTVLWGDSHGVELAYALSEYRPIIQATATACPAIVGYTRAASPGCAQHNRAMIEWLGSADGVQTVILSTAFFRPRDNIVSGLEDTVRRLRAMGKNVLVVGPYIYPRIDIPQEASWRAARGAESPALAVKRADHNTRFSALEAELQAMAERNGAQYFGPADAMCGDENCGLVGRDGPLFFDSNHPSVAGARIVAKRIIADGALDGVAGEKGLP